MATAVCGGGAATGSLCCGRQKTGSSVVCRGAVLAGRLWRRPGKGGRWVNCCPVAEGED